MILVYSRNSAKTRTTNNIIAVKGISDPRTNGLMVQNGVAYSQCTEPFFISPQNKGDEAFSF